MVQYIHMSYQMYICHMHMIHESICLRDRLDDVVTSIRAVHFHVDASNGSRMHHQSSSSSSNWESVVVIFSSTGSFVLSILPYGYILRREARYNTVPIEHEIASSSLSWGGIPLVSAPPPRRRIRASSPSAVADGNQERRHVFETM